MRRLLIIAFALAAGAAFGQVSISGVTTATTFDSGETMVIAGSGFGTKSPAAPMKYDDFEDGTDGQVVSGWDRFSTVTYSDDQPRTPGAMNMHQNYYTESGSGYFGYNNTLPEASKYYVTGWWYCEVGGAPSRNMKILNFSTGVWGQGRLPQNRIDMYPGAESPGGHLYSASAEGGENYYKHDYSVGYDFRPGQWQRIERGVVVGTQGEFDGSTWCRRDNEAWGLVEDTMIRSNDEDPYSSMLITHFYARDEGVPTPWMLSYWDEVYVDTTFARVEIGNASTLAACDHLEIQLPTAWSATSISATVKAGTLTGDAWVYVTDADNVTNSTGYPIELGGSSAASPVAIGAASRTGSTLAVTITPPSEAATDYVVWVAEDDVWRRGYIGTDTSASIIVDDTAALRVYAVARNASGEVMSTTAETRVD